MTTVTVAEAREKLPELLKLAAVGEQIVITEGGKWLAALGKAPPPPPPPTAEEFAAQTARAEEQVRKFQQLAVDEPGLVDRETVQRWFDEQRHAPTETVGQQTTCPDDDDAIVARRARIIREWLGLRADAPVPKPDTMTDDEYLTRYREAG